jgi:hypothetical protein
MLDPVSQTLILYRSDSISNYQVVFVDSYRILDEKWTTIASVNASSYSFYEDFLSLRDILCYTSVDLSTNICLYIYSVCFILKNC